MVVGEDVPVGVDDEAGPGAGALGILTRTVTTLGRVAAAICATLPSGLVVCPGTNAGRTGDRESVATFAPTRPRRCRRAGRSRAGVATRRTTPRGRTGGTAGTARETGTGSGAGSEVGGPARAGERRR